MSTRVPTILLATYSRYQSSRTKCVEATALDYIVARAGSTKQHPQIRTHAGTYMPANETFVTYTMNGRMNTRFETTAAAGSSHPHPPTLQLLLLFLCYCYCTTPATLLQLLLLLLLLHFEPVSQEKW